MRADMAKVIVERPRVGSRCHKKRKGYDRAKVRGSWEERATHEGMKVRSGSTKYFNEHLSPLRRFLHSRVGHPWDKVFSEICARVNRNSAVQDHVRDHVDDIVATHVVLVDGVPCSGEGREYGEPLRLSRWRQLYVCPRTGILRRIKMPRSAGRANQDQPAQLPAPVKVNDQLQCHFLDGAWHLVTVAPLPPDPWRAQCRKMDVVLNVKVCDLGPQAAIKAYGAAVYAVARRPLRKRELRQWPIPRDGHSAR
jgi:hypothetical protein